jgi:hypothetical protein
MPGMVGPSSGCRAGPVERQRRGYWVGYQRPEDGSRHTDQEVLALPVVLRRAVVPLARSTSSFSGKAGVRAVERSEHAPQARSLYS